jgi:hypothetical protein
VGGEGLEPPTPELSARTPIRLDSPITLLECESRGALPKDS